MTSFAVSGDGAWLVIGWRSLLLKQYDLKTWQCVRSWKASLKILCSSCLLQFCDSAFIFSDKQFENKYFRTFSGEQFVS